MHSYALINTSQKFKFKAFRISPISHSPSCKRNKPEGESKMKSITEPSNTLKMVHPSYIFSNICQFNATSCKYILYVDCYFPVLMKFNTSDRL